MNHKIEKEFMQAKNGIRNEKESSKVIGDVQDYNFFHKRRDSLLITTSFNSLNNNSISNVCFVLLVVANAGLAVENVEKYGNLINPFLWLKIYFSKLTEMSPVLFLSGLNMFSLSSLGLEILLSKGVLNDKVGLMLAALLLTFEVLIPFFTIYSIDNFAISFTVVVCYVLVFLKLISYHMTNYCYRQNKISRSKTLQHSTSDDQCDKKESESGDKYNNLIRYPDNLNVKDIYYFLFAPTLCYELNFPLLSNIRKRFLIKQVLEMFFLLLLIISLTQQLIIPIVINYQDTFQDMEYMQTLEVYLKLTIPFYTIWLLSFYLFFHSWLNVIGEILRFGDRLFYEDWWNAGNMAIWWRKWNIPVHNWCVRHMYKPMLQSGCTKLQAIFAVFFISGLLHEYFFSLPLQIFRILIFLGIFVGQLSYFAFASDPPSEDGNMGLCVNTIVAQPFILLYYYYAFYVEHIINVKAKQ